MNMCVYIYIYIVCMSVNIYIYLITLDVNLRLLELSIGKIPSRCVIHHEFYTIVTYELHVKINATTEMTLKIGLSPEQRSLTRGHRVKPCLVQALVLYFHRDHFASKVWQHHGA